MKWPGHVYPGNRAFKSNWAKKYIFLIQNMNYGNNINYQKYEIFIFPKIGMGFGIVSVFCTIKYYFEYRIRILRI